MSLSLESIIFEVKSYTQVWWKTNFTSVDSLPASSSCVAFVTSDQFLSLSIRNVFYHIERLISPFKKIKNSAD